VDFYFFQLLVLQDAWNIMERHCIILRQVYGILSTEEILVAKAAFVRIRRFFQFPSTSLINCNEEQLEKIIHSGSDSAKKSPKSARD